MEDVMLNQVHLGQDMTGLNELGSRCAEARITFPLYQSNYLRGLNNYLNDKEIG